MQPVNTTKNGRLGMRKENFKHTKRSVPAVPLRTGTAEKQFQKRWISGIADVADLGFAQPLAQRLNGSETRLGLQSDPGRGMGL